MTASDEVVEFGIVVEGHGEIEAVPPLIRRISNELYNTYSIRTTKPVRITKTTLVRPRELERAIAFAQSLTGSRGVTLVLLDADEDCPAELGGSLKSRAMAVASGRKVSIVIPKQEFESWFLASAVSLSGHRGLQEDLSPPEYPEEIRGAKEWLSKHMIPGRTYSPTVDQTALAATMDLTAARSCPSFDRFCSEIGRLLQPL